MKNRNTTRRKTTRPGALRFEQLEPRIALSATPLISEFMASNSGTLDDEDGQSSDWVELYNAGDTALNLDGWHLTEDASD